MHKERNSEINNSALKAGHKREEKKSFVELKQNI